MSQSRTDKSRKHKLETFKKSKKKKNMNSQQTQQPQPEVRQRPEWNAGDILEISGAELKTMMDFIEQSTAAFYAINGVMSRNIVNGKIKLKFDKFDKQANDYVEMTAEEEAPYQEEVQQAIQAALAIQNGNVPEQSTAGPITAEEQKDLPKLDALVDQNGNAY